MTEIASTESSTELQASPPSAAWLRILARMYDPFLWLGEIAGMRRRRSTLLGGARGRVVEIGAGTGLNIAHYSDGIAELVLTEPEPGMRRRLARRLERHGRGARIVDAPAERLPLADASVDTVVSTLVFAPSMTPNARSARSHACSARMGSCYSLNTCARARGSSRRARTTCSSRGAASQAAASATARPWS
jgi:hypothetical protein